MMAFYFTPKQLPGLAELKIKEQREVIALAIEKLSVPEKLTLNIIKLCFLIPPFLLLANLQSAWFFVSVLTLLMSYYLIMRPITFYFIEKYLEKVLTKYLAQEHESE